MKDLDRLPEIMQGKDYINLAFGRAKKRIDNISKKAKTKEKWFKVAELTRVEIAGNVLTNKLGEILDKFPKVEEFSEFKKKLFGCFVEIDEYKKRLGRVNYFKGLIEKIQREITKKLKKTEKPSESARLRKEAFGRFASVMRQLDKVFGEIEADRREIKHFPLVKENLFTVCIAGFPNVGKSTLMKKLTGANVEINSYSFTTKKLLINYIEHREQKIQIIDTPGTLDRLEKMNLIEKQAHLAIRELGGMIIFVYDPLSEKEKQDKLLSKTIELGKEIHVYMSKTDLMNEKQILEEKERISGLLKEDKAGKSKIFLKPEEVKEKIIERFKGWKPREKK